jgi:hypothetical protein
MKGEYIKLHPKVYFFNCRSNHSYNRDFNRTDRQRSPYYCRINHTLSEEFGVALVLGIRIEAKIVSKLYFKADWRYEVLMQYPAIGLAYQF